MHVVCTDTIWKPNIIRIVLSLYIFYFTLIFIGRNIMLIIIIMLCRLQLYRRERHNIISVVGTIITRACVFIVVHINCIVIFLKISTIIYHHPPRYMTNKLIKNLLKAARIYRIIYLSTRRNPLYRMHVKIVLFLTFPVVHIPFYNAEFDNIIFQYDINVNI